MTAFLVLGLIGAVLGIVLAVASDLFHVEVDERVETVTEMLPGYNCGACGFPGCAGMAEKVVAGETNLKACKPGKDADLVKIKEYLEQTPGPDGEIKRVKL